MTRGVVPSTTCVLNLCTPMCHPPSPACHPRPCPDPRPRSTLETPPEPRQRADLQAQVAGPRGAAASRWWGRRRGAPADTGAKIPFNLPIRPRVLETHPMPVGVDSPTNCTFGDPDQRTLYITTI